MAHLTCVGGTRDEISSVLDQLQAGGIHNVLALRGDPQKGETAFVKSKGGFGYASELAAFIRERYDFCLAGACYPERHPESPSAALDLENLKRKVVAGVEVLVTQLFFDSNDYFSFVARARAAGIDVPIIAGIMRSPISRSASASRRCAARGSLRRCSLAWSCRQRSGLGAADRRRARDRAVSRVDRWRRAGHPFLHAESLARDGRRAGALARLSGRASRSGRDLICGSRFRLVAVRKRRREPVPAFGDLRRRPAVDALGVCG